MQRDGVHHFWRGPLSELSRSLPCIAPTCLKSPARLHCVTKQDEPLAHDKENRADVQERRDSHRRDLRSDLDYASAEDDDHGYHNAERDADLRYLQKSLGNQSDDIMEFHKTVENLFEEEEALLNLHMNVIQENAELLTEEGRLLQSIQGDDVVDYDIDAYAARLQEILDRKSVLIGTLQQKLTSFRHQLQNEESASQRVAQMPLY